MGSPGEFSARRKACLWCKMRSGPGAESFENFIRRQALRFTASLEGKLSFQVIGLARLDFPRRCWQSFIVIFSHVAELGSFGIF